MADIISFPLDRTRSDFRLVPSEPASTSGNPALPPKGGLRTPSMDNSVARAIMICATHPPAPLSALQDSAWVIGTALRWIRRRGKARKSIPALVLELLDRHIAAGDPAAQMFANWLDGQAPSDAAANDVEMSVAPERKAGESNAVNFVEGGE